MRKKRSLYDSYHFPNFKPQRSVVGIFGDPAARVITLVRQGKKQFAASVVPFTGPSMIIRSEESATSPAETPASTWTWRYDVSSAGGAER